MTFLKEKLTSREQLAKSIRSNKYSYQNNLNLFDKIKASDYQWKLFYENILLYGGALCFVLGLISIIDYLLALVDFNTRALLHLGFVIALVLIAFIKRKLVLFSNILLTSATVFLGILVYFILQRFNSVQLFIQLVSCYSILLIILSLLTKFKPLYFIAIIGVDISIALIFSTYYQIADYAIAFFLVVFNAILLCSFLYVNFKNKAVRVFPDWFLSLCLFSFNSFNIYYLYLVNSYLSSIWNISCVMLNIFLMLFYLYVFSHLRNFLNYTIVVLSCFLGAFLTLFKFSTTLYSYTLCTILLIIALNSFVKYLYNIQVRWRNLRN